MNFLSICSNCGVRAAARTHGRGILQGLDREVDLAVLLDGPDLRLDDVALPQVVVDVLDVVPVDLGDVDEAEPAVLELEERAVRRDAFDGAVDHRPDFDLSDARTPFVAGPPADPGSRRSVCGNRSRTSMRRTGVAHSGPERAARTRLAASAASSSLQAQGWVREHLVQHRDPVHRHIGVPRDQVPMHMANDLTERARVDLLARRGC